MFGTLVNVAAIIVGALIGITLRKGIAERFKLTIMHGIGLVVCLIGVNTVSYTHLDVYKRQDIEIDYDNLISIGSMMGSGGLIVMDEDNCMVDIARFFLEFTQEESCGKCPPCRIGTKRMLEILDKITEGKGTLEDLDKLETLAETIKNSSLCGLGQTAPNPVLSTLKYFRHEYEAHIVDKKCPAGVCQALLEYSIIPEKCKGCGLCARKCPTDAISGKVKEPYVIDVEKCIKCGACMDACKFDAVVKQ